MLRGRAEGSEEINDRRFEAFESTDELESLFFGDA